MKTFKQIREERMRVFGCCELCGRRFSLELHHIIPKSMGGSDDESNLILICGVCHSRLTPKTELVKNGLIKKFVKSYIKHYLPQKYYMLSEEMFEETGWQNPFGTDVFADAFDKLIDSELERFEKLDGNEFFHWKNLDKKPFEHTKKVLKEINGKENDDA